MATDLKIKTAFVDKNIGIKAQFCVQILGQCSDDEFVVADTSGDCKLNVKEARSVVKKSIKEKGFVRILNPKLNIREKCLIADSKTSIFTAKAFENVFKPKDTAFSVKVTAGSSRLSTKEFSFPKSFGNILAGSKSLSDFYETTSSKVNHINFQSQI